MIDLATGQVVEGIGAPTRSRAPKYADSRALALGCRCNDCPLKGRPVVLPELRRGARLLAVGEAPGHQEEQDGRPMVGASGQLLEGELRRMGLSRGDVSITNAMLCRPLGRDLRVYLKRLGRENKAIKSENRERKKAGKPLRPLVESPLACCAPRVARELAEAPALLLLGATALGSATGEAPGDAGLTRRRGYPFWVATGAGEGTGDALDGDGARASARRVPALATYHPAFVLRKRRFLETFRDDLAKAFRHAAGRLTWSDPAVLIDPTLGELDGALERLASEVTAVDTETDGLDNENCALRCVGVGSAEYVVVVGFRSAVAPRREVGLFVDQAASAHRPLRLDPVRARERLANFFLGHKRLVGQNILPYDARVLERHGMPLGGWWGRGGVVPKDLLLAHHLADSELPHSLSYLASRYTDCPRWKPDDQDAWTSDRELATYCGADVAVTARLAPELVRQVNATRQAYCYEHDEELARLCVGMRRAGLRVCESERERHRGRLGVEMQAAEARAWAALETGGAVRPRISLSSHDQVRDLLFRGVSGGGLGLAITQVETLAGDPSVSKDAIYELLERSLPPPIEGFLSALLDYRRAEKMLTAFIDGMAPGPDGRVHPVWNPAGTVVGRVSVSNPSINTIPGTRQDTDSLRSIVEAEPGNVLVYADLNSFHMRLIAGIANDDLLLRAMAEGRDMHELNARDFFGMGEKDAVPAPLRTSAKTLGLACAYRAGAEKVWRTMVRAYDPKTKTRPYAHRTLAEVAAILKTFFRRRAAWTRWWDRSVAEYRRVGDKRSLLLGRRRRFLDGGGDEESISEVINWDVLSADGDIGILMGERAMESVGWPWDNCSRGRGLGGPGILAHSYDSMLLEVSEYRGYEAAAALEAAMHTELTIGGRRIVIPAEAKIGKRWSDFK